MKNTERLNQILDILEAKQSASVEYLAKKLYASPSTIRRALDALEKKGHVHRFHGGASITDSPTFMLPLERRMHIRENEKKKIGKAAAKLIENGDTIYIDSSSTVANMLPHLDVYRNLQIITNSIPALVQLQHTNFDVYCVGGSLLRKSSALTGHFTAEMISSFYINKMFFSVAALSEKGILLDNCEAENHVRSYAMRNSDKQILLLDHSKLNAPSSFKFCHLKDIDSVVSDVDLREKFPWDENYPKFYIADELL